MSTTNLYDEQNKEQTVDKHALLFGLIAVFLCGIGFSIIAPVVPFLVQPYTSNPGEQAIVVTLLTSVYAVCVFFAAPALGALSDKYGRRPLLLLCLLGSAVGYLVFGIGGALWVLFARGNRWQHQHDFRLFCRYHPARAKDKVLWLDECHCRGRHRYRANGRRVTGQVWVCGTDVFWGRHYAAECDLWVLFYA